jgi:hypothetical protein
MDFFGRQFTLEPGDHHLRIHLALPVSKGRYTVEVGLYGDKWIDIWRTTTRLTVLDTFEGHARDSAAGILNIKTTFSISPA